MVEQNKEISIVDDETIKGKIYLIRGQKVMLDTDLAEIYGYSTRAFNQQVRNNIEKFDDDFMFRLNNAELEDLRSNFLTANISAKSRALPYVFTEQGVYMLMTVLKGELAITQSKALIRTFKQIKDCIVENRDFLNTKEMVHLSIQISKNTNDIVQNSKEIVKLENKISTLATKEDLKKVMDNFIDPNTYKHFLLMNGDKIEADVAYTEIYKSAKESIYVIDNYIELKTLELLRAAKDKTLIIVFSDNVRHKDMLTKNILNDFRKDYPNINLKMKLAGKKYHDRYIAIDYGTENEAFYLCGASSKDAGNKISTISRIEESSKDMYHAMFSRMLNNKELKF